MRSFLLPVFLFLWTPCVSAVIHSPDSPQLRERVERLESQYRTDQQINERALRLAEGFNQRSLEEQQAYQDQLLKEYTFLQNQYVSLEEQLKDTRDWTDTVITFWMTMSGLVATIFGIGVPLITQRKYEAKLRAMMKEETAFLDLKARSMVTDNKSEKMDLYDQMIALQPKSFHTYTMRGDLFLELDSYKEAIADYDQAIEIVKHDMKSAASENLRKELSYIYWKRGEAASSYSQYSEASQFYDLSIFLNPKDAQALLSRGYAYYNMGNQNMGITYFKAAQKHSILDGYIHCVSSGLIEMTKKSYDDAIQLFTKAIDLNPSSFDAYLCCATAYTQKEDFKNAEENYSIAFKIKKKSATAHNNRGSMYMMQRKFSLALSDCNMAVTLAPSDTTLLRNRAILHENMGEIKYAIADYKKILTIASDNSEAAEALERLQKQISDEESDKSPEGSSGEQ